MRAWVTQHTDIVKPLYAAPGRIQEPGTLVQ
jgi:hypothetical protein